MNNCFGVIAWNVENLFHPETGGPRFDHTSDEGWTFEKYQAKIVRLAGVLNKVIQRSNGKIISLSEVENERVARDLLQYLPKSFDYAVPCNMPYDYQDNVIFFDRDFFELIDSTPLTTFDKFEKADLLVSNFIEKSSKEKLTIISVHLKARPQNQYYTEIFRAAVCENIQNLVWKKHGGDAIRKNNQRIKTETDGVNKISSYSKFPNIIILGDFNDEPFNKSMMEYLLASFDKNFVLNNSDLFKVPLYNTSWEKLLSDKPGSLYYEKSSFSKWSMLDHIVLSPSLLKNDNSIVYQPGSFSIVYDLTCDDKGVPKRIVKYDEDDNLIWVDDGYSDHLPIYANFFIQNNN